jgi:hypothetical protein
MQDIHVVVWGKGELVKLVHGSGYTDPTFVWSHQRPLAERHQLLVVTSGEHGAFEVVADTLTQQLEAKLAV